jgi:hypothetical protein
MIKNYTSEVSANRSVLHIEERLVKNKAKKIQKTYSEDGQGTLIGIAFLISVDGKDLPFQLPARIDRVETVLREQYKRPRSDTFKKIKEQAERTAWKLISDWVDIQMSMVELDQADLVEVFMPYLYDYQKERSFFDIWKNKGFAMLEDKSK